MTDPTPPSLPLRLPLRIAGPTTLAAGRAGAKNLLRQSRPSTAHIATEMLLVQTPPNHPPSRSPFALSLSKGGPFLRSLAGEGQSFDKLRTNGVYSADGAYEASRDPTST